MRLRLFQCEAGFNGPPPTIEKIAYDLIHGFSLHSGEFRRSRNNLSRFKRRTVASNESSGTLAPSALLTFSLPAAHKARAFKRGKYEKPIPADRISLFVGRTVLFPPTGFGGNRRGLFRPR